MADDRDFENGFITISQLRISSNFNEIWYAAALFGSKIKHIKVSKFCKLKMADGRFVCERLSAYRSAGCCELIGDVRLCWLSYKDKSVICTN